MQNSPDQIYLAHRNLYDCGVGALPALEDLILNQSWQDVQHGTQITYLTGVLNLIHDIDENHSKIVVEKINQAGASVIVKRRMSVITNFTLDNFNPSEISNVKIFISNKLKNHSHINRKLEEWFAFIPHDDLEQLSRLYIIPSHYNYGDYTPILCKIVIGWDASISNFNPFSWLWHISTELTFYREIGHHVFKPSFVKDADQKRHANKYSVDLLNRNHPLAMRMMKSLSGLFKKPKKST